MQWRPDRHKGLWQTWRSGCCPHVRYAPHSVGLYDSSAEIVQVMRTPHPLYGLETYYSWDNCNNIVIHIPIYGFQFLRSSHVSSRRQGCNSVDDDSEDRMSRPFSIWWYLSFRWFGPWTAARIMSEIENIPGLYKTINTQHEHDLATNFSVLYLHLRKRIWAILGVK